MRFLLSLVCLAFITPMLRAERPNVIIILSDDQGYGDFSCNGNPVLKTPNLDKLAKESVRLRQFHVAPMCTPTRGQLMTGLDCLRNGASSVAAGRTLVRPGIPFMPEFFKAAGYRTGLFGKWHLGETYPNRPNDKGFDDAWTHRGWGISSASDEWANDYFDPTLLHNDKPVKTTGYCTDVFFDKAMDWMKERSAAKEPFFLYLPTNAPHGPLWVAEKYRKPYAGKKGAPAAFFGMIANIDENMGRMMAFLEEQKIADNTILIYFHDNGGTAGVKFFNAGMRAGKTTYYEGGHRAFCTIRWPGGKLQECDIHELTEVQDLLPTLVDYCGLKNDGAKFDGTSLSRLLRRQPTDRELSMFADRKLIVQYGESPDGKKLAKDHACVMQDVWRLVHGKELYDIAKDPGQEKDVAADNPAVVKRLKDHYDAWWSVVGPKADDYVPILIGSEKQPAQQLYCADWAGTYCDNLVNSVRPGKSQNGPWHVEVAKDGDYEFRLRRWPQEADLPINAAASPFVGKEGNQPEGKALPVKSARIVVDGKEFTAPVKEGDKEVVFRIPLKKTAKTTVKTCLLDADGNELCGAYYTYVERK